MCRYYALPERLTAFLQTVTAQLITCCRSFLGAAGKLWDQDNPALIAKLGAAVGLRDAYLDAYRFTTLCPHICAQIHKFCHFQGAVAII